MSSREIVKEMREWLADVFESELLVGMNDAEVIAAVDRHFIGGKVAFLIECEYAA